jgi:hypothetical protein
VLHPVNPLLVMHRVQGDHPHAISGREEFSDDRLKR